MKLKYKVNKIRDLVVFETGIVPVEVDVERHEVVIRFKESDLARRGLDVEKVRAALEPYYSPEVEDRSPGKGKLSERGDADE